MLKHILRRGWYVLIIAATLLTLAGPTMPISTSAAPSETGVYSEDFSAYTAKHYTDNAIWDIWAHSLRVARPDSFPQSSPAVAKDSSGIAMIVWEDSRNGHTDIYAQKLDTSGNRLWTVDLRVNSDGGMAAQRYPAVAVDGGGNAVIVWEDDRNGNSSDIYAQKLDTSGNKVWPTDVRVNSDSGTALQSVPAVAEDGSGNAVIVWDDLRNGNFDSDIYAQKLGASGNRLWAADVRVNSDSGTAIQVVPVAAVDGGGAAVIVWHDYRNGDTSDIYAQKLDTSGNKVWPTDVRVNSDSGTAEQYEPAVVVDGSGTAVIVWQDHRSSGEVDIYAQMLDASGNRLWATDARVDSDSGTAWQSEPTIAMDGNGNTVMIWDDDRNGNWDIYAQKLDASGNRLWAADVRVNSDGGMAWQGPPAIAMDGSGTAVIVWEDGRNGNLDIYAQMLAASGNRLWVIDVRINSDSGTAGQGYPAIVVDGSSNAMIVWGDSRTGNWDIYAQKLDVSGNRLWAADVRVNSDSSAQGQYDPAVAVDAGGNAVMVWRDYRNGNDDIYAQKLDASGNRLWAADVRVNSDSGTAGQRLPTIVMDGSGNAVIVWGDYRNGNWDIYAQKLDASGSRLWVADVRVNSDSSAEWQSEPTVAVGGGDTAVIVWADYRNGNRDIYAQKLAASGSRLWAADVRVNSDSGTVEQYAPAVAVDESGNVVIVWADGRNGNSDVYAGKLAASGNRLWAADVRVNSDSGTVEQGTPAVAMDGGSTAAIVWYDDRNGNRDIYAQKLDTSGIKAWAADVRVNSDSGTVGQYAPAVAVDGNGNAVMVWDDLRNGNDDLYAQKVNSIDGKGWLADLQVVYPDWFYFPIGIAQSHAVDTVVGDIRQATITANYQANGGSVEFALSNNGGTNWVTATLGTATVFTTTGSDLRWKAVLTGDPVWRQRSPIVTSLRIEYSTQIPYADDYEADDTCAQAKPIATGGAAQVHTFHQPADADWTWFDVISGTTYILQTNNVGSLAQTVLELHPTCVAPPTGSSVSFGNGVTLNYMADHTGSVYIKVNNHTANTFGPNTDYRLSVRVVQPSALAIIVAGHDSINSYQDNITYAADFAYRVFLRVGLGKTNIRYLAPDVSHDADGNGLNDDIAGLSSPDNVRDAIQAWARARGLGLGVPLYVYFVDHGLIDSFKANGDQQIQQVSATNLNLWLSNLEATTGADNINVIFDACYSGSFIDVTPAGLASISSHNRVIIASTTSSWNAYGPGDGQGLYFSNAFFSALENQQSLQASFEAGRQAASAQVLEQQAWLDDNGDQLFTTQDGALAASRALQRLTFSGQSPRITSLSVISPNALQAQVVDDSAWVGVTVDIFAPGYVPSPPDGSGTTRIITVPVATLTDVGMNGVFTATHPFTQTGWYRLVAHAEDTEGNLALPYMTRVCVNCSIVYLPVMAKNW